ncbi:MAG: beta-galactosidase, partial [Armatimonadota bacterium]
MHTTRIAGAKRTMRAAAILTILTTAAGPLHAAVFVSVGAEQRTTVPEGTRVVQPVTLASENASYTLVYDIVRSPETPEAVTSTWWAWQGGSITIGMTEPSSANWYWQGFIKWTFDDESLHTRPAQFRVVREYGQDGMVEYAWDTPVVRATLRVAMVTGSDKLLMFGSYQPKQPVRNVRLQLAVYPASFDQPRNRRVTTALGTREPGETFDLDLLRERWVLFEDLTEGRPGSGSAGLLIGTPQSIERITIPVGDYGITPTIVLPSEGGSFALGLYDFPTLPDPIATRAYFARSADREAEAIGVMAAGDLDRPLPPMPMDPERLALLLAQGDEMLDRPSEVWRPDPAPLNFPWAANLPGEPINTVIFCRRWAAWETMELARRLEMEARHLYFDAVDALVSSTAWPYRNQTGIGPLPAGIAARQAATLAGDQSAELFLCAGIQGSAIPGVARAGIAQRVADGAGLMLVGNASVRGGWPEKLFAEEDPGIPAMILESFPNWDQIPGYREGERGRTSGPPIQAWRYGEGRVVHLNVNLNTYSSLVPRNDAIEGLDGATDRCLAIAARVALAAAGRPMAAIAPEAANMLVRVQDDLDRVLELRDVRRGLGPGPRAVLRADRQRFVDRIERDAEGNTIAMRSALFPMGAGPVITELAISPSTVTAEPAPPWVDLPRGGEVQCSATVADPPQGARLQWTVRDVFDRVVARQTTPAQAKATITVELPRPVTPAHILDVALVDGDQELAFERLRFAMTVPYPFDDFTALMWSYAGGDPVLQRTDRMCYEWGAGMNDLCHMGGYSDAGAAREYSVSARSGLRLIPYVTRIAGEANERNERVPCLHDPALWARLSQSLSTTCRQAAPYSPAAYTLGDENYLFRGNFEVCHTPESVAAFRDWLVERYQTVEALNAEWATRLRSFEEIARPMILEEAAQQAASFAPWIDHKLFMDHVFAWAHEECARYVQAQDPGARVGWDGLLSYSWRAGYDFEALTRSLALNQTYTSQWLQGELYRSFKRDDALTGKWGNAVADGEAGFRAHPWDCLLAGDNSVWWWTSWGCDYIPFNPDLSQSDFGRWFFEAVR